MPRVCAIVIERNGVELHRFPYRTRQPDGAASALAEAYASFRKQVSDDGVPDEDLIIRFERKQHDTKP